MPGFRARELCPHGVYLPSRMAALLGSVRAGARVFAEFSPDIEPSRWTKRSSTSADRSVCSADRSRSRAGSSARARGDRSGHVRRGRAGQAGRQDRLYARQARRPAAGAARSGALAARSAAGAAHLGRRSGAGRAARAPRYPQHPPTRRATTWTSSTAAIGDRAWELRRWPAARIAGTSRATACRSPTARRTRSSAMSSTRDDRDLALTAHAEAVARRVRHDGYRGRTVTLKIKLARARGGRLAARRRAKTTSRAIPLLTRVARSPEPTDDGARDPRSRRRRCGTGRRDRTRPAARRVAVRARVARARAARAVRESRRGGPAGADPRRHPGPLRSGAIGRAVAKPDKLTPGMQKKRGE